MRTPNAALTAHGLPARWQGRGRFVLMELGLAAAENFLAARQLWRDDPLRCAQLVFIAIEPHPPSRDDLANAQAVSACPDLADELVREWPPLTPNLHGLSFDDGRVQLQLAIGGARRWIPDLAASVDAFIVSSVATAGDSSINDVRISKGLGRLAAAAATLSVPHPDAEVRQHLQTAGFTFTSASSSSDLHALTVAHYAPAFMPRRAPARNGPRHGAQPHALIVGAGLAGCAAAWALAEHGWCTTVFERHAQIAMEASGNPAGLFHGIVNASDGVHARFNRAASLTARRAVQLGLQRHDVRGATDGLLRLEPAIAPERMRAILTELKLPADYVQALDAEQARALSGIAVSDPAWYYPGGGWVHPAGLARSWMERAAGRTCLVTGVEVDSLCRTTTGWRLVDAHGGTIAESPTIVLANAGAALRLLGAPGWPIDPVRGQISLLHNADIPLPRVPVVGAGYLLPEIAGQAIFGATSQRGDTDPAVRMSDHLANLRQLERLTGRRIDAAGLALDGRTAWRWSSRDRLPVIGAVPDRSLAQPVGASDTGLPSLRLDHPRFVPRLPGLFVFTALGSRGITWSALGAQALASIIAGAPAPLEASLLNAIDPARFVSRQVRRRQSS